jgi:hypothetical protein
VENFKGEFNYVVAQVGFDGRLHCYSYGSQVQFGTREQAKGLCDYVNQTSLNGQGKYQVYKLDIEQIK